MTQYRAYHDVVLLNDGGLLITGSAGISVSFADAEIYN